MADKYESFFKSFADAENEMVFRLASDNVGPVPVIRTGSYLLDDALSSGGYPKGRIIQLYGRSHSGKTLMAMLGLIEAQKEDPDSKQLFIDAEQTFSPQWAKTLGADISRIIVIDGDLAVNGRRCFEMILGVPKEDTKHVYAGKKTEGLLDKIAKKELNINYIVLDSLGAIIPPGEDISAVGKMNMSLLARFLTTTFRKLSLEVSKAMIPMIIVNHTKDNMDPYGADHTFSGGNSYAHFLSANIFFEAVNRKDAMIVDEDENKLGATVRATVEKSKFGVTPSKCEFKVHFAKGIIDLHEEVAILAVKYGIVEKITTVTHAYGKNADGEPLYTWVGSQKYYDGLLSNPKLVSELLLKIEEARFTKLDRQREDVKETAIESSSESDLAVIEGLVGAAAGKKGKKSK